MKKISFLTFIIFFSFGAFAQTPQQLDNQYAFAKTYGYLKYFYPGDEAAKIDWDKFAFYGAQKVENCKNAEELKKVLNEMVVDLMPGVKVLNQADAYKFDEALLKPNNLAGFDVVSWQHLGVGLVNDKRAPYQSARTNRAKVFTPEYKGAASAITVLVDQKLAGKNFVLTYRAKMIEGDGKRGVYFRVDQEGKNKYGFLKTTITETVSRTWSEFTIKGKIDKELKSIVFGAMLYDKGKFAVDDLSLKVEGEEIYLKNFDDDVVENQPSKMILSTGISSIENAKYIFTVKQEANNKYLLIESPKGAGEPEYVDLNLFDKHTNFGEYVEKSIGNNLKIIVPLALYGTKENTYPNTDSLKTASLIAAINNSNYTLVASDVYFRLGNVINTWNVFQHFYPYFDVVKTNWENDLKVSLNEAYQNKDATDYYISLKKLTAKLKDGHVSVTDFGNKNYFLPPIAWKWVENKLIITSVFDKKLNIKQGDIVEKIDGIDAKKYFEEVNQYISAATNGWLNYRAELESLYGLTNSEINISLLGQKKNITIKRTLFANQYQALLPKQTAIKLLGNQITYISFNAADMKIINDSLSLLKNSKAIIFDLRGRPNENAELLEYLMAKDDTASNWFKAPEIIYPDQEKIVGFKTEGWDLKAKPLQLTAKIFFLIDGRVISAGESYASLIEHYKLGTLIGQPTAGTNGEVNTLTLPGGYVIRFTGLKALKQDGSQHHGIGIIPNIYVGQTTKGIKEGRDEILERAIAEALK